MSIPMKLLRNLKEIKTLIEENHTLKTENTILKGEISSSKIPQDNLVDISVNNWKSYKLRPNIVFAATAEAGIYAKNILSLLRPMNVVGGKIARIGNPYDGGYVMLDQASNGTIAYSIGINDDVSWDLQMAERGYQLYQYDHTIDSLPIEHPQFHWFRLGLSSKTGGAMISMTDAIRQNGHIDNKDMILKMDIEDAEWDVLGTMPSQIVNQFSQIVLEMHKLCTLDYNNPAVGDERASIIMPVLEKMNETHQVVHVHGNNWGTLGIVGGVMIPDVVEVTYIRRSDYQFEDCSHVFPTALDMPCRGDAPDFFLGALGALPRYTRNS